MNWFARIDDLEKNYTEAAHHEACDLAAQWSTCMCGAQDPGIPRYAETARWRSASGALLVVFAGQPKDRQLYRLGIQFSEAIQEQEWSRAREIGAAIQIRAAWVLANLHEPEVVQQAVVMAGE